MASYIRETVDAAMAVKEIEGNLKEKDCTSVVNMDVRGAFDAAWWPSILRNVKELKDRLCGLVVRVSGYRFRGLGFDSRRYQIF